MVLSEECGYTTGRDCPMTGTDYTGLQLSLIHALMSGLPHLTITIDYILLLAGHFCEFMVFYFLGSIAVFSGPCCTISKAGLVLGVSAV